MVKDSYYILELTTEFIQGCMQPNEWPTEVGVLRSPMLLSHPTAPTREQEEDKDYGLEHSLSCSILHMLCWKSSMSLHCW